MSVAYMLRLNHSKFDSIIHNLIPTSSNYSYFQIVPPVTYSPRKMRGDFILKKCLVQSVSKWRNGIFMVDFSKEEKMALTDFEQLSHAQSSTPNEDEFWNNMMKRNRKPPMYTVENEDSMYPNDFLFW